MKEMQKDTTDIRKYGQFGGQYIPETLVNEIDSVSKAYDRYKDDPEFLAEFHDLLNNYANRPSLLYYAEKMTKITQKK